MILILLLKDEIIILNFLLKIFFFKQKFIFDFRNIKQNLFNLFYQIKFLKIINQSIQNF